MRLVCDWSLKLPVQDNCSPLPVSVKFSGGGAMIETTLMLPSTARLLAQITPAPATVSAVQKVAGLVELLTKE